MPLVAFSIPKKKKRINIPIVQDSPLKRIYFVDEKSKEYDVTRNDLKHIIKTESFPKNYTKLILNGEYCIESNEKPYKTTYTDKIEFDCDDLTENQSQKLSVSFAEVSWLGARELQSFVNMDSTIADKIIKSYAWKNFYIVVRQKNVYSLQQYIYDLKDGLKPKCDLKPVQIMRKLGCIVAQAHQKSYGECFIDSILYFILAFILFQCTFFIISQWFVKYLVQMYH